MKKNIIFQARLDGVELTPAVRMTRRGAKIKQRAIEYNQQQLDLADWLTALALEAKLECPIVGPVTMKVVATYTDRRRRDAGNVLKAVEDAFVLAGILKDDSAFYLPTVECTVRLKVKAPYVIVQLRRVDVDKEMLAEDGG